MLGAPLSKTWIRQAEMYHSIMLIEEALFNLNGVNALTPSACISVRGYLEGRRSNSLGARLRSLSRQLMYS